MKYNEIENLNGTKTNDDVKSIIKDSHQKTRRFLPIFVNGLKK